MFDMQARTFVAGQSGLVGSAVARQLQALGADQLVLRTRQQLDLTNQTSVEDFFASERPEYVFFVRG